MPSQKEKKKSEKESPVYLTVIFKDPKQYYQEDITEIRIDSPFVVILRPDLEGKMMIEYFHEDQISQMIVKEG